MNSVSKYPKMQDDVTRRNVSHTQTSVNDRAVIFLTQEAAATSSMYKTHVCRHGNSMYWEARAGILVTPP